MLITPLSLIGDMMISVGPRCSD